MKAKGGKKNRKHDRNLVFCLRYGAENRRKINKIKKVLRHVKKHPNDKQALSMPV